MREAGRKNEERGCGKKQQVCNLAVVFWKHLGYNTPVKEVFTYETDEEDLCIPAGGVSRHASILLCRL